LTAYLIDSSVFIQAKNQHYGFDFCPAFWDWLTENSPDTVASVHAVGKELLRGNDSLAEWAASQGDQFFLQPDSAVEQAREAVGSWAAGCGCDLAAMKQFMTTADHWIVAHALACQCSVVTQEMPADTPSKIKIPNACRGVGVNCILPYEMLRRERARFVLEQVGLAP